MGKPTFIVWLVMIIPVVITLCVFFGAVFRLGRKMLRGRRAKRRPAYLPPLTEKKPTRESSFGDTCDWAEDILPYTRGRLSGVARERFEFHLRHCDSCGCQVENLRQTIVCPYDFDVKSLHGEKPISVGPGGRLRAHWVHAANKHVEKCPRCKKWVDWLFATRLAENIEVQNLEQQFAAAPKTDRT